VGIVSGGGDSPFLLGRGDSLFLPRGGAMERAVQMVYGGGSVNSLFLSGGDAGG
jgi:hypothetical protein